MPKISINILTKNRSELLKKALASVIEQTFKDFEIVVVNDGSTDGTSELLKNLKIENLKIINHSQSLGIIASRQEALAASAGEHVAILDDDDYWVDPHKLKKQTDFLNANSDYVLVGGGIRLNNKLQITNNKFRPQFNTQIRRTMLFRNNFFTSTVMFRRDDAVKAGGFVKDYIDLGEDYDLWLRLGKLGKMYNFQEVFTLYARPSYNKEKFKLFLRKQSALIKIYRKDYSWFLLAFIILKFRILFGI
jgi:glycosyltransferase involved in cell wall biosynthesis